MQFCIFIYPIFYFIRCFKEKREILENRENLDKIILFTYILLLYTYYYILLLQTIYIIIINTNTSPNFS